jgi:class 3 adenylate cyclase/DNA-binding SARP family transcriptional activator/predicted ATPase
MPHLHVYLLGPPRVERDSVPIQVDTRKAIALLAYLSVTRERHRRDALAALLWPESDQSHARTALRRTLYALRKALAAPSSGSGQTSWLDVDRESIGLDPGANLWLDVQAFHGHLAECDTHGHPAQDICPACLSPLTAAAVLYRGDFLSGFGLKDSVDFDDWQFFQADALRRMFAEALEKLVRCHSAQGAFASAIDYARRWLALDHLNEAAHRQLMQLYAWSGQRPAALHQYSECAKVLKSQLGALPSETTTALYAAIAENHLPPPPLDAGFQQPAEPTGTAPSPTPGPEQSPIPGRAQDPVVGRKRMATVCCPRCEYDNPPGMKFCGACGTLLSLRCPDCGAANPLDFGFCGRCGVQLVEEPAPALSQIVEVPGPEQARLNGERRRATVILADVKGSTALAEQIDVETWVEIMNRVFHILGSEIYRFGGEVDQYRGDGLVAFFGAKTAHEDDPERAVRAALAMQQAIRRYATELAEREGIELRLRVGVNTGDVIAARVGNRHQHREDTAMGRTVALAARMETAAEPDTVLVTEHTYRLVQPLFEWKALGEIAVKGVSQPVAIYRPLAAKIVPGKPRGIAGLESPLVGREAEFRVLRERISRLQTGVGGIVTLVGEAGIGKSRLIAELRAWINRKANRSSNGQAVDLGPSVTHDLWPSQEQSPGAAGGEGKPPVANSMQWAEGRCLSYTMNVAYQLWLDMLRALLGVTPDAPPIVVRDTLERWVRALCPDRFDDVYPYLGRIASLSLEEGIETELRSLGAESLKVSTFCAVETLIASAARRGPLVIVCEDLHWADPTSLELLERLLSLTDRVPLLVVCVFRPEPEHGCWGVKETAARRFWHRYADLWLGPLSDAESETLAGHLLRVEGLSPRLRARILDHAEGNPFYVEEILRSLIDSEVIVHDEATNRWYAAHNIDHIPFPDTLHGVLMARIDRLEAGPKHVLQLASVIGRIFTYPVLSAIVAKGDEQSTNGQLEEHLVALQRAQMIRERVRVPEREYIFKHELTREAAYNGLLRRERRSHHRQVAEALERLYPARLEEQVELLAHHWERAEEPVKAADYLLRAGDQARAAYANREAIAHLAKGLALLKELPETPERSRRELDLLIALGIPLTYTKGYASPEVRETYARARGLCELVGGDAQQFSVLVGLRRSSFMRGELQEARKLCEQILSLAGGARDPTRTLFSYTMYVEILYFLGEFAQVRACCEHVSALYDPAQHRSYLTRFGNDAEVGCRIYEALALWHLGYPDQSLRRMRVAVDLAEELSYPFTLVFASCFAAILHQLRREPTQVRERTEVVMRISSERGFVSYSALGTSLHGWARVESGEDEGIAQLQEGIAARQAMGEAALVPEQLLSLAEACGREGNAQEALRVLDKASCLVERTGQRCWQAELCRLRGELLLARGDAEDNVEACFQRAIDVARRQSAKSWELRAATSLARLWHAQGTPEKRAEARELLQGIYDWFTEGFDTADLQNAKALLDALA